jgi:hypothetical protein
MGRGKDQEEAQRDALSGIKAIGLQNIKNSINLTLNKILQGYEYDLKKRDWVKRDG